MLTIDQGGSIERQVTIHGMHPELTRLTGRILIDGIDISKIGIHGNCRICHAVLVSLTFWTQTCVPAW
jgi:hypothetical protein